MPKFVDLTGQRFGRLTVRDYVGYRKERHSAFWVCECDCGNRVVVSACSLKDGHTTSCGCYKKELTSARFGKHHETNGRLYRVWKTLKSRCNNPNASSYKHYGAKGIKVCSEWDKDYSAFARWAISHGYDENAPRGQCTIDRIDFRGDYCPDNCRIVDMTVQNNHKENNATITYNGVTHTVSEWSRIFLIPASTVYAKRAKGLSPNQIFKESETLK